MLVDGWSTLGRTLLVTVLGYTALLVAVRLGGKRTLAKLNAFDWIVTVAFGSALASVATSQDVSVAEGAVVFGRLLEEPMRRMRVTEVEIHQAVREAGLASPTQAATVVLETNGGLSVITETSPDSAAMGNVEGW